MVETTAKREVPTEPVMVPPYRPEPEPPKKPGLLKYYLKALWDESVPVRFGAMLLALFGGLMGLYIKLLVGDKFPSWALGGCLLAICSSILYVLYLGHTHVKIIATRQREVDLNGR